MTNRNNPRRGDRHRMEHGPRWENPDPGKGCNSTHVAKARRKWKQINRRAERRKERNRQMETDPSELAPVAEGKLVLAELLLERLMEVFEPNDPHPSVLWITAQTEEDQLACLRWASCVLVHDGQPDAKVPPAPQVLKDWADSAVPKVVLVFREGAGGLGEPAEATLEALHDRLDQWYRRVALNAGSLEDGEGPFPSWTCELHFQGYDEKNDNAPIIGAHVDEKVSESI